MTSVAAASATTAPASRQTSLFVNGLFPRRRGLVLLLSVIGGLLVAYAWKAQLSDDTIGFNSANAMLGHNANNTPITSIASGVVFAFVSGLAGSFTACNVAVFGAVGPLVGREQSQARRLLSTMKPIGWLAVGMIPVSAIYGAVVGVYGTRMPQFSTAKGSGFTPRTIQSMTTFGLIGLVMIVMGLASLGVIRDPLARISARFGNAPLILMGALIGGFLIGRPYPLFRDMFRHAATTHNPAYGAAAFALQSIGNIIVMSLIFVLLSYVLGGKVRDWLTAKPARSSIVTTAAFVIAGIYLLTYWDIRVLSRLGYFWFPTAPWS